MLTREDRNAIDGLFDRLTEAERRGGPRDAEAEAYIRSKIAAHPAAPYYLAQTVVVQQEALKEAERRIEALERNGRQIEQRRGPWDRDPAHDDRRQNGGGFGGGGFLAGAAQTALGRCRRRDAGQPDRLDLHERRGECERVRQRGRQ